MSKTYNAIESYLMSIVHPINNNKIFIKIDASVRFEPHGRASETWEIIWKLELPEIPYHWIDNKGEWIEGTQGHMVFYGESLEEILEKAESFLFEFYFSF